MTRTTRNGTETTQLIRLPSLTHCTVFPSYRRRTLYIHDNKQSDIKIINHHDVTTSKPIHHITHSDNRALQKGTKND